jgi:hypothetical protein
MPCRVTRPYGAGGPASAIWRCRSWRLVRRVEDGSLHEAHLRGPAQLRGDRRVALAGLGTQVDSGQLDVAVLGEEAVRREAEVRVAAAQVDDPHRPVGGQPDLRHRGVQRAQEGVDLATLGSTGAQHREERVARVDQVPGHPVVPGVLLGRRGSPMNLGGALLGHPQLHGLGRGLHVPVAERLGQQRVDSGTGIGTVRMVGGRRGPLVVGDDLQVAAGLEVDRPDLDPAPRRGRRAALPGGDGAHQRVLVEQQATQ